VRARSRAASSRTWAFSRKRGAGRFICSPCRPRGARLKERPFRATPLYPLESEVSTTPAC